MIARLCVGVLVDRSLVGQKGSQKPFRPVPQDKQKWAMTLLGKYIFAPNAFEIPEGIMEHLQWERRGFSGTRDPKLLDMYLNTQKGILNHFFHVNVLKRISDTELYGNGYGLNEMMLDLTTICFSADAGTSVNAVRRNLQIEYTERLIRIVQNKAKDKKTYPTLRLVVAAIKDTMIAKKIKDKKTLPDNDLIGLLKKMVKKLR